MGGFYDAPKRFHCYLNAWTFQRMLRNATDTECYGSVRMMQIHDVLPRKILISFFSPQRWKKQKNGIYLIDSGLDSQRIFWKRIMINKLILAGLLLRILDVQTRVVGNEDDAGLFERKASPEYDGYLEEDSPAVDATTLRLVQAVIIPFFISVYIGMSTQSKTYKITRFATKRNPAISRSSLC